MVRTNYTITRQEVDYNKNDGIVNVCLEDTLSEYDLLADAKENFMGDCWLKREETLQYSELEESGKYEAYSIIKVSYKSEEVFGTEVIKELYKKI